MADLFDVIADPTRRDLLQALLRHLDVRDGEASVGELVADLSLSQPTVSKHLKVLREFAIVTVREQGQHRYYRLDPTRLQPVTEWLSTFLPTAVVIAEPVLAAEIAPAPPAARPLSPSARRAAAWLGSRAASAARIAGFRG